MHHDVSLFLEVVILEYSHLNPSLPYPTLPAPEELPHPGNPSRNMKRSLKIMTFL